MIGHGVTGSGLELTVCEEIYFLKQAPWQEACRPEECQAAAHVAGHLQADHAGTASDTSVHIFLKFHSFEEVASPLSVGPASCRSLGETSTINNHKYATGSESCMYSKNG